MNKLGVNIDHVATLRQARHSYEPDPVWAAVQAQLGGADLITVHLREDRRHIQDRDVERLRETVTVPLNLEMAAVNAIVAIALRLRPAMVTLVPEKRIEVTTEGGLNVATGWRRLRDVVRRFHRYGIAVSAFIDAERRQVLAARRLGCAICEIHTGPYANAARGSKQQAELEKIRTAGEEVLNLGMQFNAGHGLNYQNVTPVASLPGIEELHIGHAIISRAVFIGLRQAVAEMKAAMVKAC